MVSRSINNKSSYRMHKDRKKYLKEYYNSIIDRLTSKCYKLGLRKKENIISPLSTGEHVCNEEKFTINENLVIVERKLFKLSKELKYDVILTFDDNTFDDYILEEIRCKSLSNYIVDRIIPRIINDLKEKVRKINVLLKIERPNMSDLQEREAERDLIASQKFIEDSILEGLQKQIKEECKDFRENKNKKRKKEKNKKKDVTIEEKTRKWKNLKDDNIKNFKEKIKNYHISIILKKNDIKPKNLKRKIVDEVSTFETVPSVLDSETFSETSSDCSYSTFSSSSSSCYSD